MQNQEASFRRSTIVLFAVLVVGSAGCGEPANDVDFPTISPGDDQAGPTDGHSEGGSRQDGAGDRAGQPTPDAVALEVAHRSIDRPRVLKALGPLLSRPKWPKTPWLEPTSFGSSGEQDSSNNPPPPPGGNGGSSTALDFLTRSDTRAMWVWDESPSARQIIGNAGGAQDELLQFAGAPHGQADRKLTRLFFEARGHSNANRFSQVRQVTYDPLLDSGKQTDLHSFLRRAHRKGLAVEYLDGQAIWLATDANAEAAKQICRDVVAFNRTTSDVRERFDGVHFDIEPHTVRSGPWAGTWWQNRLPQGYNADWTQRWKAIMNSCRATFDTYQTQTGHQLVLATDVGADYGHYNKPILNFFNGSNSPIDYVGVMNYYDNRLNANGQPSFFHGDDNGSTVVGGVDQNLAEWTQLPVLFGMETGPLGIAPDEMSFAQEGYQAMNAVCDTLAANYAGTNTLGIAIHHYGPNAYKAMSP